MRDMNRVILLGRLGNEPVQRSTRNGKSVVQFPLATSRQFTSTDETSGEEKRAEETEWHRVVVWGKQGEACAKHLVKGQRVMVEGAIRSHQFDGKDGIKRTSFEVVAESVSFLDKPRYASASDPFEAAVQH